MADVPKIGGARETGTLSIADGSDEFRNPDGLSSSGIGSAPRKLDAGLIQDRVIAEKFAVMISPPAFRSRNRPEREVARHA